ncbi:MAG: hypothetical protein A3B68_03200 [Candidatus Melainabacteria bacterium RIFCSPHIGHO2_02_FULL_34_12]|nr:MAG: hypothetical protein A3B68_03200 [Candidatus Melainabacteria bacterium RIFCSPHIGHO2_02_FULL_34_12]
MQPEEKSQNLCELIKTYMLKESLSCEKLAEKLGVAVGTVYNLKDPEKAQKTQPETLNKVSQSLGIAYDVLVRSQELLNPTKSIPTEKEIESGERKLSICTSCYKIEKITDENYVGYKILSPTFYSDCDYLYCVDCGSHLDGCCHKCKKPKISLEHKHCPYCGNKYLARGGTWCKSCKYYLDYKQINSRTIKCPSCSAPFPYNLEFGEHSNIKDSVVWTIYLDDVWETNKKEFEMMYPIYEVNNEISNSKIVSIELRAFLLKCVESLNSKWMWKGDAPCVDKCFLTTDSFLPPSYGFFASSSIKPSTFIVQVAYDFGLFGQSSFEKRLCLPPPGSRNEYDEHEFFKFCSRLYKSGEYSKEYLEHLSESVTFQEVQEIKENPSFAEPG